MDTQNKEILKYLETHKGGITSVEAFRRFGITRLGGRIFDLRSMGNVIDTSKEKNKNGKGVHARYFLIKKAEKSTAD